MNSQYEIPLFSHNLSAAKSHIKEYETYNSVQFSVYATRGNSQRIFVSLGHRSTLNTYTDSFFHYYIFSQSYLIVLVFLDRITENIVYTVQQEAH